MIAYLAPFVSIAVFVLACLAVAYAQRCKRERDTLRAELFDIARAVDTCRERMRGSWARCRSVEVSIAWDQARRTFQPVDDRTARWWRA